MYKTDVFISAEEIKEWNHSDLYKGRKLRLIEGEKIVSEGQNMGIDKKAYSLIQELNAELKEKGYLTVTGRVSRKYFEERFYGLIKNLSRSRKKLWRSSMKN